MKATLDEEALMEACQELAARTMFDSEPEPTKLRAAAQTRFSIAAKIAYWISGRRAAASVLVLLVTGSYPLLSSLEKNIATLALRIWTLLRTLPLSAFPLWYAGSSYLLLIVVLRPDRLELAKRLVLGMEFLLWVSSRSSRPAI